ncbi:MAG TPA: DUF3422 domain-containing protein [Stellaceae bacterium]|nr:DUF3422 domain-containing protein [Stellaceae bacterium]
MSPKPRAIPAAAASGAFPDGPPLHPQFAALARELHARPFGAAAAPARIFHLALAGGDRAAEQADLARLCAVHGLAPPPQGASQVGLKFAGFHLTWERHAEFSTYTFVLPWRGREMFPPVAKLDLPLDWLASLPGGMIAGMQLALIKGRLPAPGALEKVFGGRNIVGGTTVGGRARLWTDLRPDAENRVCMIVHAGLMPPRQTGRLVQRLLEIETYAMMALLALPVAREIAPSIAGIERGLAEIAEATTGADQLQEEQALLKRLTGLAAELATLGARTPYRFGAGRAYYQLVRRRIEELREERIEARQTIGDFMERRLSPAMRTCETTERRLETLSERAAWASDMLRTRIDVTLAAQNRDLLHSMNRRALIQFRLQQTVEGVSVAAITYYGAGLVSYMAKGLEAEGYRVHVELTVAASIPIIAGLLIFGLWRLHKWLDRD